jgi:LuxR family maltose regulon positive regulatory protein
MNDLLVTKFCAPQARPDLVQRPHLFQRLNDGLHPSRKLILVSAPAGYGKTTLITEWLKGLPGKTAWLSLDEGDNDPALFLAYLVAALQQIVGGMLKSTPAMLQSTQPLPTEVILTSLINEIAPTSEAIILALDDYHVIQNPAIQRQVAFFLEHQPPPLHLIILTRQDPFLPLTRLRAGGQMIEIREDQLRFSLDECACFLQKVMGLNITNQEVASLERRTEGWIAGLQLAALSMQGKDDLKGFIQAFTGSSRYVLDYLMEEVYKHQSLEIQDFLVKTSILERLSAPLCDATTDRLDSQEILRNLEQANLFILPLEPSRTWYRYHRLFSELLHHRLPTSEISEAGLHQRASQWFETNGYPVEATRHALAAQDWARSARLIEQTGEALLKRGELVTLIGWCEKLPDEVIASRPQLELNYAWALSLIGRFDQAESLLERLESLVQTTPAFMGQVASAQAYVARGKGDNPRAIEKSRQALALLPASDSQARGILAVNLGLVHWHAGQLREATQVLEEVRQVARQTGNIYALLTAQTFLARTRASQGELRRAQEMYQHILREGSQVPILALAHYDLSGIYYEWNDLLKAGEHLEKGMELCIQSGNVEFQNAGHILRAVLNLAEGDPRGAITEVEISHSLSRDFNPSTRARSAACHAQIALAIGDVEAAAHWLADVTEEVDAHSFYRFIGLMRPRLLIAQGKRAAASQLLAGYSVRAAKAGWGYALVAIRILQSLASEQQATALDTLEEALQSSQPEGFIRAYVDAGRSLVPLLLESARRGVTPVYIGQILNAFGADGEKRLTPKPALVEALSERELEVLRLVAVGLSNREIAAQLFISLGTAKTHIHNICGKLNVRNRTEAAAQARKLNLL